MAAADLGGSIFTGIDGNQLAVLARQLRIPLHDIDYDSVPLYMPDGSEPDAKLDKQVSQGYTEADFARFTRGCQRKERMCAQAMLYCL